jgi:hypothetical protein
LLVIDGMRVFSGLGTGTMAVVAILLVSGLVLCLAHGESADGEDACAGFGPAMGGVALLPLARLGPVDLAPAPPYHAVIEDPSAPPPEA